MNTLETIYQKLLQTSLEDFYEVESDFFMEFDDMPEEGRPDYMTAFMTIYNWFAMSLRSGVWTFYEGADPEELKITREYLKKTGDSELEEILAYGIHDYQDPKYAENFDYPESWIQESDKIDDWIWEHQKWLYQWEQELLLSNKEALLKNKGFC